MTEPNTFNQTYAGAVEIREQCNEEGERRAIRLRCLEAAVAARPILREAEVCQLVELAQRFEAYVLGEETTHG